MVNCSPKIELREVYGDNEKVNVYVNESTPNAKDSESKSGQTCRIAKKSKQFQRSDLFCLSYVVTFLKDVFLPQGFPDSVHPDYIPYQIWDTVQAFASTVLATLTTHSILEGVGVGESTATPLAAAISWILKDGTGMIGRIFFAWWKGSDLDAQSKKWRLVADVLNDIAMGIELTLPYFSQSYITILLCLSTSMKSIVGVAGGATRAALTEHQALNNNLADVSAKDGSQETFVNLIASFVGIFILSTFGNSHVCEMYLILVAIHIYANYSAVKALRLNSLNEERLAMILSHYCKSGEIASVEKINNEETLSVFNKPSRKYCNFNIKLGVSMSCIVNNRNPDFINSIKDFIKYFRHENFLIIPNLEQKTIYIILKKNAQSNDMIEAYFHAFYCGLMMAIIKDQKSRMDVSNLLTGDQSVIISNVTIFYLNDYNLFFNILNFSGGTRKQELKYWYNFLEESEWNHERNLLPINNWRGEWSVKD